jgi:uncharacterized protein YndB with AHSA1/START domain
LLFHILAQTMASVRSITQTTFIPSAAPAEVYDAFVNAKTHARFTGAEATGAARVGGRFAAWNGYIQGVYRDLVKGKKIVADWRTTEWPAGMPDSHVEFTFKAAKGGTEVRLVHTKVPAEQAASYRQGWIDYYWKPLNAYFSARTERG